MAMKNMTDEVTNEHLGRMVQAKVLRNVANLYTEEVMKVIESQVRKQIIANLEDLTKSISLETMMMLNPQTMRDNFCVRININDLRSDK